MSMVTRCPTCATVFRVTPQQLQAHQGQVRCGRCMAVFDGFGTLATLPDQQPEEPARFTGNEGASPRVPTASSASPSLAEGPLAIGTPASAALADGAGHPGAAVVDSTVAGSTAVQMAEFAPPLERPAANEPEEQVHENGRARGSRAWAAAAAVMLLVLAAQAAYAYRGELVANYPVLKPIFARLCSIAGCRVPLPQRPQLIVIEASDLQVEDQLRPGMIQLTATLRNHAGYEVGYPALDLVLTNTKQHALARRIFLPAEYLEQRDGEAAGLAAHAEVTIRLVLDTGDLGAAGFRLALLPARP
jgi:predicted Zn finger-like uncharacterized protein